MNATSLPPDRTQMRQVLATLAAKATETLPAESAGRIAKAVKIVLNGDVELLPDGTATVGSMTDPAKTYSGVNGTCPCRDFEKAPAQWCAHRISRALTIRLGRTLPALSAPAPEAPAVPLPEAPASVNVHLTIAGRQVQLTLRDTDETRLLARLTSILAQYPPTAVEQETATAHVCPVHQVPMRQTTKNGRTWYSHRTGEGWCKGH